MTSTERFETAFITDNQGLRVPERRQPRPPDPLGYIDRMPARVLLERLPVPIWAVHSDGIIYANRAFTDMLGYPAASLSGVPAAGFIVDAGPAVPAGVLIRRHAGELLDLRHADGSIVKVIVSEPMLWRCNDPVTLVGVQDVTKQTWENGR
jgi:PAS domain S-box-containing protein